MIAIKKIAVIIFILLIIGGCSSTPNAGENPEASAIPSDSADSKGDGLIRGNLEFDPPSVTHQKVLKVAGKALPGSSVNINTQEQVLNEAGEFVALLDLNIGLNRIPVKMVAPNSRYSGSVFVEYQPIQKIPALSIDLKDTYYFSHIIFTGKTDPGNSVKVNNMPAPIQEDGEFLTEMMLPEGRHIIRVQAINDDKKTTTIQKSIQIVYPLKKPSLVVSMPEKPGFISRNKIKIQGFTDVNNLVEVYNNFYNANSVEVFSLVASAAVDRKGVYIAEIALSPGTNKLLIRATDPSGAVAEEIREIYMKK